MLPKFMQKSKTRSSEAPAILQMSAACMVNNVRYPLSEEYTGGGVISEQYSMFQITSRSPTASGEVPSEDEDQPTISYRLTIPAPSV